jgi:hypothetical protein
MTTPLDIARAYLERGFAPIPARHRSKIPTVKEWESLHLHMAPETLPQYFNGQPQNIGVALGAASGGLIDVDLDTPEALALADYFLPRTSCEFGHASKLRSHREFVADPLIETEQFKDVEKATADERTAMLVEIRSTGAQTIFPGSEHESGEPIEFTADGEPARVDGSVLRCCGLHLAIAALLVRHWPAKGARHEAVLAAAGFLLRAGIDVAHVASILTHAARHADPSADLGIVRTDIVTTADKLTEDVATTGGGRLAELLRGDGAAVVRRLRQWLGVRRSAEPRWRPPTDLPVIDTGNLGLAEMGDAAWAALDAANTSVPVLYQYGDALAWLTEDPAGRAQITVLDQDHVRHLLARVATFIRWAPAGHGQPPARKPAFPPVPLAADLLAVPRPTLPRLQRLVRIPVFTADSRLLTSPGYDAASGLYVAVSDDLDIPSIPASPSGEDIGRARHDLVTELLGDFPLIDDADKANAVALLLTPLLRELAGDDLPLFVLTKPSPRTGASLLAKVVSILYEGRAGAAATISRDEEEMRKRLTAFLLPSPTMLLLDNIHGRLDSAALAAILTCGGEWRDRLLGQTREVLVPVRSLIMATGNNVVMSNETAGRSVLIRRSLPGCVRLPR